MGQVDGGDKNLSDDYDAYTNRRFTVTNGEVSAYSGTHWLDDGKSGPKPNGKVPYIRLFPYADTTNPGGVYILATCSVQVCEKLQPGWTQSYPPGGCYSLTFTPTGFDSFFELDFGNWYPVSVTACKRWDLDGKKGGETVPVAGWMVSLTKEGAVIDTEATGSDGCYTWGGLTPGFAYDVHEGTKPGWAPLGDVDFVFEKAKSAGVYSHINPDLWIVNDDFHKAARSLVAAYLNASWGMNYPYTTTELIDMWTAALSSGELLALHDALDAANNAYYRTDGGPTCPISASLQ